MSTAVATPKPLSLGDYSNFDIEALKEAVRERLAVPGFVETKLGRIYRMLHVVLDDALRMHRNVSETTEAIKAFTTKAYLDPAMEAQFKQQFEALGSRRQGLLALRSEALTLLRVIQILEEA